MARDSGPRETIPLPLNVMARLDRATQSARVRVANETYDHLGGPLLLAMTIIRNEIV